MASATGNPLTLPRLLGVLLLATAVSARADSVTLTLGPTPASAVTNGTLVPISVTARTNGAPILVATSLTFRTLAPLCTNTWNTLPLTPGDSPTNFLATIPRLPTGKVEFAASCTYVDSGTLATTTVVSATTSYIVGRILEAVRNQTFENGPLIYSGSGFSEAATGWSGTLATNRLPSDRGTSYSLNNSTNCIRFNNADNASVVSPVLPAGIGTIYFQAGLRYKTSGQIQTIVAQISTNDGVSWTNDQSFTMTPTGNAIPDADIRPSIRVNLEMPVRIRIYQPSLISGSQNVYIDNILLSAPPVDVQLSTPADAVTPKDPVTNDTVTIACNVQDFSTNAPSINRRVKLIYSFTQAGGVGESPAVTLPMTNTPALPDQYSAVVPALGAGTNRYYYRCDFDGYYYTNSERRGPYYLSASGQSSTNVIPTTNRFSYTINAANVRTMRLLPAGGLGFGFGATNAASTKTLLVCNDGNASLNITDILSDSSCFVASPTSFSVAAQRTQSVNVVFQPVTNGPYTATLTVLSDKTTGANTCALTGTGADPEVVTAPTVSGATAGTLAQTLAFSAAGASDSWAYGMQYQFTSSDGWSSSWSSATSTSHVWSTLGTFQVYAQARSTTNPAVVSALSSPLSLLITNTAQINLGGVTNFGIVSVNQSSNLVLQITNAGPGALTISNISITNSAFTSLTTSLLVLPNTSSNVLINFAPTAPGVFTDVVVVVSDATSGTYTWRVTGVGEQITLPLLQPADTTNTLYLNNQFTALATNSTGEPLNYQFDWGDGTALTWGPNVASGVTYTNTHAWAVITTNSTLQVRARCFPHTNNLTAWSTALVTITNAYIMGLSPTLLDFGSQVTNQTTTRTLTINNVGNGAFNVTSLACPSGFDATATVPFALLAGASTSVTLRFTPPALGIYGGVVTVNTAESMAGVRTLMVTGFCEVVSVPVCTNNYLVAHVNDPQLFGFAATSTLGHALEYYYAWGDGATTNWTNSAAMAHAWGATNANDYPVLVQARCLAHTNILSVWSSTNLVRVYAAPLLAFSTITNGQPFQVTMTATGAAAGTVSNCVFYFLPPLSAYAQPTNLTFASGNDWKAGIPQLNSGTMTYYLQYMRAGVPLRYPALTNQTLAITNALDQLRWMSFESGTWSYNGGQFTHAATGWTGTLATNRPPSERGGSYSLNNSTMSIRFNNTTNASIVSPVLPAGIGTIYYEAGLRYKTIGAIQTIVVEVSIDGGANWTLIQSFTMTPTGNGIADADIHPTIVLNLRMPAKCRIRQPAASASSQNVYLDNIIISPPPTDVRITEVLKNPGYPSCKDPVRLRCQTADFANLVTGAVNAPSVNRRLSVYYKHDSMNNFVATNMTATGATAYEVEIPTNAVGSMQYYFRCDFDGYFYTNSVITNTATATASYPSEQIPRSYLPDARTGTVLAGFTVMTTYPVPTTANALSYLIRFFRSAHDQVWIQSTPASVARQMDLVDDYIWQGTTLITGITNLTWYYQGYDPYSNNATAFGAKVSWGDTDQYSYHYPPMGGYAELGASQQMQAELTYDGLLVHRFVSTNANYLVRKGVYQTFDQWPARQDYFEDSLGIHAVQLFTNYFTSWASDFYPEDPATNMNFSEAAATWYSTRQVIGASIAWGSVNSTAVVERSGNQAMYLNNSTLAPGSVWNTENHGLTEGVHGFSARARLSQNDGRYAVTRLDLLYPSAANAYRITNTLYVASMSAESPYISTLFCYSTDAFNSQYNAYGFKYYELRLTQETESTMSIAIYRYRNDIGHSDVNATLIKQWSDVTGSLTGAPIQVDIAWTNIGTTNVWIDGRIYRSDPAAPLFTWPTNRWLNPPTNSLADPQGIRDTTASQCITSGGGVGFLCRDAELEVRALTVARGTNLTDTMVTTFTDWYLGRTYTGLTDCWAISGGMLRRSVPVSTLNIYTRRVGTAHTSNQDVDAWTNSAQWQVSSFNYSNLLYQPNYWDKVYVEARFASGELPIVVDDLSLGPWRAYTRGMVRTEGTTVGGTIFWDWSDAGQQYAWAGTQPATNWLTFEAMVTDDGSDPYVALDVSRANPSLSQGVWSLMLTNGLGSIAFRARVTSGTSCYRVEAMDPVSPEDWLLVESFSNTVADGVVDRFVPVRYPQATGRIRIVQLPTGSGYYTNLVTTNSTPWLTNSIWVSAWSSPDAILKLDNLTVRDYPPADAGTWRAYNCLIASPTTNNQTISRSYEGPAWAEHRTCYLNNSPTDGVLSPGSYRESNPYLQSPVVDTGIGQIAFWYRAWDSNAVNVSIQGASSETGTWSVLTNFTVTSMNYDYFDTGTTLYDQNDTILRIYVTNAIPSTTTGRLCIDNVLMAEAARSSYTITDVQLLPAQPLYTNQVGVQVTIDRFLMDPQDTRLYLSYVTGTSNWGYRNWWGMGSTPTAGVVTVELTNSSAHVFVSAGNAFIPPTNIDEVVQYLVWGTCAGWTNYPIFQGTNTYTNPTWYHPVNLNSSYAAQGWSPYYYVYSCPTGSVWVNEIFFNSDYTGYDNANEFIELVGPRNAKLGGWLLELCYNNGVTWYDSCAISSSVTLPNDVNGWGFFVWGDAGVANVDQVFVSPKENNIFYEGGVRLVRSMGAWEDLVCWGSDYLTRRDRPYRYAGYKDGTDVLYLAGANGSNKYCFVWNQYDGSCTPGAANTWQTFANIWVDEQMVWLTSIIGPHGAHSLLSSRVQLPAGATPTVTYTADPWYRIQSFTTDNVANDAAINVKQFVWAVTNMQRDYSNSVSFYPLPEGLNTNGAPVWWLSGFGRTESEPFDLDGYSLSAEYLLNQNPYVSNATARFTVEALAVTGATVNVTVQLLESTNALEYVAQPNINGTLYLLGTTNLNGGSWSNVTSQAPTNVFDANGRKVFSFPAQTNRFYKAYIQ